KAVVVERTSAAQLFAWDLDMEPGIFQNFHGGLSGRWMEMIVERVCPKDDRRSLDVLCRARIPPRPEGVRREPRNLSLRRDARNLLRDSFQQRRGGQKVHKPGGQRGPIGPCLDKAKEIGLARPRFLLVIMREK